MVIDASRRLMLYAVTDGSVASLDIDTLGAAGFGIASNAFSGAVVGAGRIITYDSPNRCGQPVSERSAPTATDCLAILNAGVGLLTCDVCVCDVDASGATLASDALRCLARAVGQAVTLTCSPC
jgi:hypothetical protein